MRPEWCPADVWEAAREALIVALRDERCGLAVIFGLAGEGLRVFQEPIARAILAERKRCAAIAFDYPDSRVGLQHTKRAVVQNDTKWAVVQNVSGNIAAAIRGGTAPIGAAATQSDGGGK